MVKIKRKIIYLSAKEWKNRPYTRNYMGKIKTEIIFKKRKWEKEK